MFIVALLSFSFLVGKTLGWGGGHFEGKKFLNENGNKQGSKLYNTTGAKYTSHDFIYIFY